MAQLQAENKVPDPVKLSQTLIDIARKSQRLANNFWQRHLLEGTLDWELSANLGWTFLEMAQMMLVSPVKFAQAPLALWRGQLSVWQRSVANLWGHKVEPVIVPEGSDKRFRHADWQEHFLFDFIKQSYLLTARWIQDVVGAAEGLDMKTKRKMEFYARQFVDALSPTNFLFTNPEVLRATIESGGENLLQGLSNLLSDLERGKGSLSIRTTDLSAFTLGVNVASTPGKVVYQNELMQLIQYTASTGSVFKTPLLIVPPWINKFYILDLRPENSLIKWWVDQGFTVFVISWVNPDGKLAEKNFENYLLEGTLKALEAIGQATGERKINAVGYCLGGTLLASTVAFLAASGSQDRITSCTFLTTLLDFARPGELEVFIDEEQIAALERFMERKGYLEGSQMAATFSMLRANDLIWSFFINNYLLGKNPFPFDLLFWNSDSTRMPARMHSFYLRQFYQRNLLRQPGGITLGGRPIELGKITVPAYFLSTVEDHIAPWKSTYEGSRLLSGPIRFVLGGSGHIAGVINPPAKAKYCYWTNGETHASLESWLEGAERSEGSWWADWLVWVKQHTGETVAARKPGAGKLAVIEDAPGAYVKLRLVA
jgi:polyhydroxyalkanoate synthase